MSMNTLESTVAVSSIGSSNGGERVKQCICDVVSLHC